jgi:hypothetical protein
MKTYPGPGYQEVAMDGQGTWSMQWNRIIVLIGQYTENQDLTYCGAEELKVTTDYD